MKTTLKKTFAILMSVFMLLAVAPLTVFADDVPEVTKTETVAAGYLRRSATINGETVTWKITHTEYSDDTETNILTISGNGSIPNYWENFSTPSPTGRAPFYSLKKQFDTVVIEEGITGIGTGVFTDYTNIKKVTYSEDRVSTSPEAEKIIEFSDDITKIGFGAFKGCSNLEGSLVLSDNLTEIGNNAFRDCYSLTGPLCIPNTVTTVGDYAFCSCYGFDSLVIGDHVEYIGNFAFGGRGVTSMGFEGSLYIPDSVKTIGDYAFAVSSNLNGTLRIGNNVESIGNYAFYFSGLTGDIVIPGSVKSIGDYAFCQFNDNGFNGTLTLGNSVETIGESAFSNVKIKGNIFIPASVVDIHMFAFLNCSALDGKLIFENKQKVNVADCAFHGCASDTDIRAFFADYPEFIEIKPVAYDANTYYHGETLDNEHQYYEVSCADCKEYLRYIIINNGFVQIASISVDSTLSIDVGDCKTIVATVAPDNASNKVLRYTSSNTDIAVVDHDGIVTGVGEGTAVITVSSTDGSEITKTVAVTVTAVPVTSIVPYESNVELNVGGVRNISTEILPVNATYKNLTYISSDDNIATVSANGLITAKNVGTALITITAHNGVSTTMTVTVKPVPVTTITTNVSSLNMKINETSQITASVSPANATDKSVSFTSSDPAVCTVDNSGLVTAIGVGSATITVLANDGSDVKKTISVTVTEATREPEPEQPAEPEKPSGGNNSGSSSFADVFRNFFVKIIEFFRNLFKF